MLPAWSPALKRYSWAFSQSSACRVVVGEEAVELLQTVGEEHFDRGRHLAVQLSAALQQDALVGRLLDQGVLEDVLELGVAGLLAHELARLKIGEVLVELPLRLGDGGQHPVEEAAAR